MAFSENLQFIRAQAGVTQEQLAEQLEVSRQSVSKWEGGQSFPEMDTLLRICDLYDVNLDTLLRGSVEESRVEDTARYDAFMTRFAWRIALATGGIIAGVGLCALLEARGVPEMVVGFVLLLIIAVCTVVFVASGIQHDIFRKRYPVIADFYTQEEKDAFHQRFVWHIAGGVGAILFAGCRIANVKIEQVIKMLLPYFGVVLVALLLVTYIPFLSMAIPNALGLVSLPAGFNMFFVG